MKIVERFVKPIVLSILDTKKFVSEENVDRKLSSLNDKIVETEQKVNIEKQKTTQIAQSVVNLISSINDNRSNTETLSKRFIQQSAKLEEILIQIEDIIGSISTVAENQQELSNSIRLFDDLIKTEIKKTRADVAVVVKQTRDDVDDLKDKLDAFIDTISETISELKK